MMIYATDKTPPPPEPEPEDPWDLIDRQFREG
jgi:hypothetical protein